MEEIERQQQLLELIRGDQDEETDKKSIRYALYARKSTSGDEKQESSISDQIRDCMDRIIVPQELNVVKVYEEKFSAKVADTRDEFTQLIKDIQAGKIDGLIAWHPDRLSRNMKEAGSIIDLVDRKLIKDLQFPTFTFENTPAGKMLLGITFVMAKQYSEHLSESVSRGNRRAVEDGEFIGKFKHGYIIDAERHFQPDPVSFLKVKHIFSMALEGESQKDMRLWINNQNYTVQKRRGAESIAHVWSKDDVSELLRDPLYAGVFKWGETLIKLNDVYPFEPILTVNEFLKINKIDSLNSNKILTINRPKGGDINANFLRQLVYCGHCNETMTSMMTNKKNEVGEVYEYRYYYRCDTPDCKLKGRSARAKFVIDVAQQFLSKYLFVTKSNYVAYIEKAKIQIKKSQKKMSSEIERLKIEIGRKNVSYERIKKLIENDDTGTLHKHYDLDSTLSEIKSLKGQYDKLLLLRKEAPLSLPTFEEYLKLFESTSVILNKIRDMRQMDAFLRIFFSNFTITATGDDFRQGSEVTYKLKEPWYGFLENGDFSLGAGEETLTLDLFLGKEAL